MFFSLITYPMQIGHFLALFQTGQLRFLKFHTWPLWCVFSLITFAMIYFMHSYSTAYLKSGFGSVEGLLKAVNNVVHATGHSAEMAGSRSNTHRQIHDKGGLELSILLQLWWVQLSWHECLFRLSTSEKNLWLSFLQMKVREHSF